MQATLSSLEEIGLKYTSMHGSLEWNVPLYSNMKPYLQSLSEREYGGLYGIAGL